MHMHICMDAPYAGLHMHARMHGQRDASEAAVWASKVDLARKGP